MYRSLLALILSASIVFTGCASTTVVQSEPTGAQLRIDGQPVGATPVTFTENAVWLWTKHQVTLDASGYSTYHGTLNAQVSPLYLILGLLCLLPFILVGEFKPTYYYVLAKKQASEFLGRGFEEVATVDFR